MYSRDNVPQAWEEGLDSKKVVSTIVVSLIIVLCVVTFSAFVYYGIYSGLHEITSIAGDFIRGLS